MQPCKSGHCEYGVFEGPDLIVGRGSDESVSQSRVSGPFRNCITVSWVMSYRAIFIPCKDVLPLTWERIVQA